MQEIVDYSKRPPGKPTDWIPISIALAIFFAGAITVLFFVEPPKPPTEPLKRGTGFPDSAVTVDKQHDVEDD